MVEPQYPVRPIKSIVEPHFEQIRQWLKADSHRAKKEMRTAKVMFNKLKTQDYAGSYVRLCT
jgi:hypothetical protein